MHYIKQFKINGVDTKQVACIELQGKPNAATVGAVGLLGIDMISPLHEVYKCVAVNGSIYTWELMSGGLSTIASTISADGAEVAQFPYDTLKIPQGYLLKAGDLIIDSKGYEYQIKSIDVSSCSAEYCGTAFSQGEQGIPGLTPFIGENGNWWIGDIDTGVKANTRIAFGTYRGVGDKGTATNGNHNTLTFDFAPRFVYIVGTDNSFSTSSTSPYGVVFTSLHKNTSGKDGGRFLVFNPHLVTIEHSATVYSIGFDLDGNTIRWWSGSNAAEQLNELHRDYVYMAIGE